MHSLINKTSKTWFLLLLLFILAGHGFARAQEAKADPALIHSGIVVDSYGNPIVHVEIQVDGTEKKILSDESGHFEFSALPGSKITYAHPDFYTQQKPLQAGTDEPKSLKIQLTERYLKNPKKMDVLYGVAEPAEFLGSASTIYTEQLSSTLSGSIVNSFAGRMTGLYTQQYSGIRNPSTSANATADLIGWIPVTGAGSPSDNTQFYLNSRGQGPVVVVDGVQRELFSVDPENIESVSIQKDALSSILLGMRSSRGVLLITTKKPAKGGFQLSFTGRYGVQSSLNTPEALPADQYAYLLNEALQNDGKNPAYTSSDYQAFKNGSDPTGHPNVDWYNQSMKKNAPISSYNLNISGGSKNARYFVSLGYFNQEGLFRTSGLNNYNTNMDLNRYLINSKIDVDITDEFKVGVTIIGRTEEGNQPGAGYKSILNGIYTTPNSAYPVLNPNGSYGGDVSFTNNIMSQTNNSGYTTDNTRDVMANINMDYDLHQFLKGLSLKAITNISTQNRGAIQRSKQNMVYEYKPAEDGSEGSYTPFGAKSTQSNRFIPVSNSRYWYGQLALNYTTILGKNEIEGTLYADKNVVSVNFDLPMKPANIAAKAKYNFDKKYFAEATVNRSYFNGYKPGNQWGTFYAFGLGWDVSKENFLKDVKWMDQLKLRAVYGQTGNGIENSGYYIWRQAFRQSVTDYTYPQGYAQGLGIATIDNAPLANENITWEKAHKINLGADIALFKNHLVITADYYHDKYYDLLQTRGKDIALMGFVYPQENIGKKLFTGTELSVTYQNNWGNFNYFVTANWGQNTSKVLFIDEQYKQEAYNRVTGRPDGALFGLVADGFFNTTDEIAKSPVIAGFKIIPGDIRYKDLNNDGVVNQYDQKVIAGDKPLTYYGVTTGFNFHGFDFNVLFQGAYNRDIYLGDNVLMAGFQGFGQSYGQAYTNMINRWTPETAATATFPRLSAGGNAYNMNPNYWASSFWVKSGNYFRVKDINLAYTLPAILTKRLMNDAKVKLFVSAQNLITKSACDLVDPEVTSFSNYPIQRVISTGINVKF